MTRVVLVAGPLEEATSFEYHNFLIPLRKMGLEVMPFDFVNEISARGKEGMNTHLLSKVREFNPNMVLFVPHTDQFYTETIDKVGEFASTVGYFFDDMWRINYSRFWAKHFNYVTTSDVNGIDKFRQAGLKNVIYSPFACNPDVLKREELPKTYDVSFIGGYHPQREWYLGYLKNAGIRVEIRGNGWPGGMVDEHEMVRIFNQSKINLNLSNCISFDLRCLFAKKATIRNFLLSWRDPIRGLRRPDMKTVEQVKARHFEICACGGFQLSYYVEGLEKLLEIGREVAIYCSPQELVEKIHFFIDNEDGRNISPKEITKWFYLIRTRNSD